MFATHISIRHSRGKWREVPSFAVCHFNIHSRLCRQVVFFATTAAVSWSVFMFWCRYVHLSKDDVDIDILQATVPTFMSMQQCMSDLALTTSNRIQHVRKPIAMPPKLLVPSNKVIKIKTNDNGIQQKMKCRIWSLHNQNEDTLPQWMAA